jgi:hypothetical protein
MPRVTRRRSRPGPPRTPGSPGTGALSASTRRPACRSRRVSTTAWRSDREIDRRRVSSPADPAECPPRPRGPALWRPTGAAPAAESATGGGGPRAISRPRIAHPSRRILDECWVDRVQLTGEPASRRTLIRLSNQQGTEDDVNRRLTAAATVAVAAAMALPGTVYAAGQVEQGNGRSICHFSGLNDDPGAQFPDGGRVQSYGQLVRQGLKEFLPSPGVACNPTSGFGE